MSKRKAEMVADERLRKLCAAQYGSPSSSTTTPATEGEQVRRMAPPLSSRFTPPRTVAHTSGPTPPSVPEPTTPTVVRPICEPSGPPRTAAEDPPTLRDEDDAFPDDITGGSHGTESSTCTSVRCNPKKASVPFSERKKGFLNMDKVKNRVKRTGHKIEVEYCEFIKGPKDPEISSLLVNSVGCIIRNKVKMIAPQWHKLEDDEKKKLVDGLTPYFNLDFNDEPMWQFLKREAISIYKDFKGDFSRHYKAYGPDVIPPDLIGKDDQWEFLCTHFASEEFQRRSKANTANRKANVSMHHSGRKCIAHRMQHYKEQGEEFPIIKGYKKVYPPDNDPTAARRIGRMVEKAAKLKEAQKKANPDIPEDELPPLDWSSNLEVLEYGVGMRRGKEVRGLGKAGVRELPARTSRAQVHEMEERIQSAEQRAEQAEAGYARLQGEVDMLKQRTADMDEMKKNFAALMTQLQLPAGYAPQVPTQQQPDDTVLD